MKIAVLRETKPGEARVAISPDVIKKFVAAGHHVAVETGAGLGAYMSDEALYHAGAEIAADAFAACHEARIVLCVNAPNDAQIAAMTPNSVLVGMLAPQENPALIQHYAQKHVSAFALEWLPRISRAQAMDVLSSQSNLAGYRAVIDGVAAMSKALPMMMTAAGTVAPAKVLVLGAGVAGLQAIATAKRLGAVVSAFDVRPAVKEQVESLGAKFIEVKDVAESGEGSGGYAKEMSEEYKAKQAELIADAAAKSHLVITTALIPGRAAPVLVPQSTVERMMPGSVVVDMAVMSGGNCPLSQPDQMVEHHGVTIVGYSNLASRMAADTSPLYARNLYHFVQLLIDKNDLITINTEDEILRATLLTQDGAIVHPQLAALATSA